MSANDKAYRDLAAMVVEMQKRLDGLSTNQLAHSSLEDTGLPTYDGTGQLSGMMGRLPDGSYGTAALSGPVPPIPSAPKVRAVRGIGLEIEWDGLFDDSQAVVPLAGGRLEVYVHNDANITPILVPTYTLESPRGGKFLISVGYDLTHYVAFAFRASSGKVSPASAVVGPCTVGRATVEDLDIDFELLRGTRIFYGPDEPETTAADLWLRDNGDGTQTALRFNPATSAWIELQDQGIVGALQVAEAAQAAADAKARIFTQPSAPTGLTADDVGDLWVDTDDDNVSYTWALITGSTYGWVKRQIGNGAIAPQSLVASNVVATGTVTAALFEALLVLATEIIAGDPLGNHARMTPQGFRVYQFDPIDGLPKEVIRMGTETSDYFGVVNALGELVASIDNTGSINGNRGNFRELWVAGRDVEHALTDLGGRQVGRFSAKPGFNMNSIYYPMGVAEVGAALVAGRAYRIDWRMGFWTDTNADEALMRLVYTQGNDGDVLTEAPAPSAADSPTLAQWYNTGHIAQRLTEVSGTATLIPDRTTRFRIGLTMQRGPTGSSFGMLTLADQIVQIIITDLGPAGPVTGTFSPMGGQLGAGGGTPPPTPPSASQQYFVDLAPAGWVSIRGNGSTRDDVTGPVQGWDPSGYNGDGKGHWWFNMPNIQGFVDRVTFYAYANHWGPNSGGTALINMAMGNDPYNKAVPDMAIGGWPKPGGREFDLPAEWLGYFRSPGAFGRPQANGITVGPSGSTSNVTYGRFDGPSARLRIWFTQ